MAASVFLRPLKKSHRASIRADSAPHLRITPRAVAEPREVQEVYLARCRAGAASRRRRCAESSGGFRSLDFHDGRRGASARHPRRTQRERAQPATGHFARRLQAGLIAGGCQLRSGAHGGARDVRNPSMFNAGGGGRTRTEVSLPRILSRLIIAKSSLFYGLYFHQM